jgi:hypothetical protein
MQIEADHQAILLVKLPYTESPYKGGLTYCWKAVLHVRIYCIELVGLHHLFYKGVTDPLGLQASSPVCRLP